MEIRKLLMMTALAASMVACAGEEAISRSESGDQRGKMEAPEGWTDMSGSFEGWRQIGDANWRIEDGVFVADSGSGHLVTEQDYEDFRITLDFWVDEPANSGVFLRASDPSDINDMNAYEVNIFDTRPDQTYRTGSIVHFTPPEVSIDTGGRWNSYDIQVIGDQIRVRLNGVTTATLEDDAFDRGPISLQYGDGVVKFRNVFIKEL